MCDSRRNVDRHLSWVKVGFDGAEVPVLTGRTHKWRVGGWVGGLYGKLKEVRMDGKGTLKMFTRKKRELIKTPSISKKSRSGSPGPQTNACSLSILQEQPRKDGVEITVVPSSFSTSSSHLSPATAGFLDSSLSCPGTPATQHAKQGVTGSSNMATLRRPTSLSRHASAAGFPLQSWVFTKGQGKGPPMPTNRGGPGEPVEGVESTAIEVEDIPALLRDVARFAEAVEKLKDVVLAEGKKESRRPVAHECLGEVLRVLRQVINTYPLLNTVEILTAAGKLISKVKGFHYELCNDADKQDFEKAIETIAVAFSSNVSELLMGEVDSSTLLSLLPTEKSRSLENLYAASGHGADGGLLRSDSQDMVQDVDVNEVLQRSEGGVDSALLYAKTISKYMKDLITYVEKRTSLEMEFSKGLQRLYQSCKHSITHPHMPLFSIYSLALEQDQEQSVGLQQAYATLHNQTFIQPLMQRKQEHEKKRKEIKEAWIRAKRKLMECEANLRKAKQAYVVRCEDYDKAKAAASRAEEEAGGKTLEKKKRVEEDARNKAEEAEATYKTCIADATTQDNNLQHTKVTVLRQLQDLVKQSDQTLRSATISYYQIMHMQTVALPVNYQTLCESSKLYDLGQQYGACMRDLQLPEQPVTQYTFEPYSPSSSAPTHQSSRSRNDSFNAEQSLSNEAHESRDAEVNRKRLGHKSWGSTVSDDSVGAAGLESPTISTNDDGKLGRSSSTGTMSSNEDAEEKDGNVTSFVPQTTLREMNGLEPDVVVSTGPFRNIGLSKAAQTHRLRKLRTPAKCRECDSYVYFQGGECEECFLACHKRCLETLAIQCGHKKLHGRLQLFGQDFSQVAGAASDGVPFIITKCISEIERRALKLKGIYRVNGVKTRVEKLCQVFENGKELVELSQCSPHDISNVLKLYLRQLPEPIMLFRLYHSLMGLSKESLQHEAESPENEGAEGGAAGGGGGSGVGGKGPELVDLGDDTDPEILVLVEKLRNLLKELPKTNMATLRYIVRHLRRISELEQDNKMSPSNLGIVFGPSLMRPRPTGATVSLSSLVDYPHQARIIEALIVFYAAIFQPRTATTTPTATAQQIGTADGSSEAEETKEASRPDSGQVEEEGCASSPGSTGSNERLPDSDPETDEVEGQGGQGPDSPENRPRLTRQQSQFSVEDEEEEEEEEDQESPEPSGPLGLPVICIETEEGPPDGRGEVPALPDTEPPEEEEGGGGEELSEALAELNVNQSNNNCPLSPQPSRSGLTHVCRKQLPLTRNRDQEPEFV
ncbi:rho GTPase-activating protein 45 isoform X1 [Gadus morhua]|uniref:Rho GTPase activating protein 45b n=1 Tax=Gadus morhua TaxID=8049 RepID=A0A8C5B2L9_GADMO|nr:rho GTPase-activating protein 45 isoform X1 [Gadus morhua]